jgi:hypothetical protein
MTEKLTPFEMGYVFYVKQKAFFFVGILPFVVLLVSCGSSTSEEKTAKDLVEVVEEIFGPSDSSSDVIVDESSAREWPAKFCSLEIGSTREQIQKVMGEPTQLFRDQTANQDKYEAWGYDLTIFYDIDNKATQIQPNSDNVPCETKFSDK